MKGKSLISITTCNRIDLVKKFIWEYLRFVNNNEGFHFVLALDGHDTEYVEFCENYNIPLLYSDQREGVGLSKNRVLKQFPNYDYYFFIDDDVELLNDSIFSDCINVLLETGYHHLCGNHISSLLKTENILGKTITHSSTGGGYFSCYSRKSIEVVGGWNTIFAKYKRFGHSEHSYRVMHSGLQPSPFVFAEEFRDNILVHSPPSVSKCFLEKGIVNEWAEEERRLIEKKTTFFSLKTICPFYFNQQKLGHNKIINDFLSSNSKRYPLTKGKERLRALGEFYALLIPKAKTRTEQIILIFRAFFNSPTNIALKHYIKTNLFGRK